ANRRDSMTSITGRLKHFIRQAGHGRLPHVNPETGFPADFEAHEIKDILAVRPYTMTSPERIVSLIRSVRYVVENRLPGDIVECGVYKGGSIMAVARTLLRMGDTSRDLYLYDTFEGMAQPTEHD